MSSPRPPLPHFSLSRQTITSLATLLFLSSARLPHISADHLSHFAFPATAVLLSANLLRRVSADQAELDRLREAYEARLAAQPTEAVVYSWEFNKSAEISAERARVNAECLQPDYTTYDELAMFSNVPKSFEPKVSEPYNRYQLWRIFNFYDKDKNKPEDNPYAKKYNKVVDRVKYLYKKLVLDEQARGTVNEHMRYDALMNRSKRIKHQLQKVEKLKNRLLWYGTPRTTSEMSLLYRYVYQQTMPADAGKYTSSVSPWFKIHPPYTIPDGRIMFWTDFHGSPEQRIPYARSSFEHYDARRPWDSGPINLTAQAMDPLPWKERKRLGGYSNKYMWPPRTTPTAFWRPTRATTLDISEHSDYIYIYDEKNPRPTRRKNNLDSSLRDRMDSAAYSLWRKENKKRKRKMFEEERAELLRDNNLTDSHSGEKRIVAALRNEVDPARILPGKHEEADEYIRNFARQFIGCFAPTVKIWFNEDLTLKPRFVDNTSRRTVNLFDELYPTICQSHECSFNLTERPPPTTILSLETLYDGLETSEEAAAVVQADIQARMTQAAVVAKTKGKARAGAVDALDKLTKVGARRGRPKKVATGDKVVAKAKTGVKKSKASEAVRSKRSKRNVEPPEAVSLEMEDEGATRMTNAQGKEMDTDEMCKSQMDQEDKAIYEDALAKIKVWEKNKKNKSMQMGRPTKRRMKPTYVYTSRDEEEAEKKWKKEAMKKGRYQGSASIDEDLPPRKRSKRSVTEDGDPIPQKIYDGQTIITMENSTPPYLYFQQKVYPSHNLTSAQLNDEAFCRELIPKLEEDNKMMMAELRRRATAHAEDMKEQQKDISMSEINEDESFEQGLKSAETTTSSTTCRERRRRRRALHAGDTERRLNHIARIKRAANLTQDEYVAQLKRNLEVYGLIDAWKEEQVKLAMVPEKERYLLNKIDQLRDAMNMSHGKDDPHYQKTVAEAIRREKEEQKLFKSEIDEWWSKEQKERREHEAELVARHKEQGNAENAAFSKEEERLQEEQIQTLKADHEKEMKERVAKGLPPDEYDELLPQAKLDMAREQKEHEEDMRQCPKTLDELMKDFDGDANTDKLKKNLEVYDLIEKWKKRKAQQEALQKAEKEKEKVRKKRQVQMKALKRMKRKTGVDSEGEYVESMSRYHKGKKVFQDLHRQMKGYRDTGDDAVSSVCSEFVKNHKKYDQPDYRRKRDVSNIIPSKEEPLCKAKNEKTTTGQDTEPPCEGKHEKTTTDTDESFDASDLKKVDEINAMLDEEGYNPEQILKDLNATQKEDGDWVVRRRRKRNAQRRIKRAANLTQDEYVAQLKRNLEVYGLIDAWKEEQVKLAMVPEKERYLLNKIDQLRDAMNMSHGKDDPHYQKTVAEAIRREKEEQKLFKSEIDEWWSKEQKERREHEAELVARHKEQGNAENAAFSKEEERLQEEQIQTLKADHEKEMKERVAKGLPPDEYDELLPQAKLDMAREQKEHEEDMRQCPKTLDELMKDFDGDANTDKLKKNLEVYDLIEKWKKRKAQQEALQKAEKEKEKVRRKRQVQMKALKSIKGKPLQDPKRANFHQEGVLDFDIKRHGNTSKYELILSSEEPVKEKQNTMRDQKYNEDVGLTESNRNAPIRACPDRIFSDKHHSTSSERLSGYTKSSEYIEQRRRNVQSILYQRLYKGYAETIVKQQPHVKLRARRDVSTSYPIDKNNEEFSRELARMIDEHAEKQKLVTGTPKKRPTAASEYPLRDDFVPFNRFSSAELRKEEKDIHDKNRFAFFKAVNEAMGTTTTEMPDSEDETEATTTVKSTPVDKIKNLRAFIRNKLADTVNRFSNALSNMNATTTVASVGGPREESSDIPQEESTEMPGLYRKLYAPNPDDLLHKKDVTFKFGESIVETTPTEELTFSPVYTFAQAYHKYNFTPVEDMDTTAIIFSITHTDDFTYSPTYNFHRYYYTLDENIDQRTTDKTEFAFGKKYAGDAFTFPTFEPEGTLYTYDGNKLLYENENNQTTPGETTSQPEERSTVHETTSQPEETSTVHETTFTPVEPSTLQDQEETTLDDLSDIEKFHPPNMDEIKQYIDSVTKSREKFCKKNFEWDSENSVYTLIEEETTTPTVCPKMRAQDRAYIEALQRDGIPPGTKQTEPSPETPNEEKKIYDKYNLEEPHLDNMGESSSTPAPQHGAKVDLKSYLTDLLHKYSQEIGEHNSAQKRENAQLKQKLLDILTAEGKSTPQDISKTEKPEDRKDPNRLKSMLQNLLHKYSQEVLHTDVIANNRTKAKYRRMKNIVRVLIENFVPNQGLDMEPLDETVELTSAEREKYRTTTDRDRYDINLKQQIHKALDTFSEEGDSHQKRLKTMVRRVLRDSFEHLESDYSDEPVFNKTRIEDMPDYITNDVCTDRRFKTDFRAKLRNLLNTYSREILAGTDTPLNSREKRVNKNMLKILRVAVESASIGPEMDRLADYLVKIEDSGTLRPRVETTGDVRTDLRAKVEHFMASYTVPPGEDSLERDTRVKLKTMLQDLLDEHSFEYTETAEMEGKVKRIITPEQETEPPLTTVLNTEERLEVEAERRLRTPTYDYYSGEDASLPAKYRPGDGHTGGKQPAPSTLDYFALYRDKVEGEAERHRSTTLSPSREAWRDKYVRGQEAFGRALGAEVSAHAARVAKQGPTTLRPWITRPDPMITNETSEEEPFQLYTSGPVVPRIEQEWSDSREYEVPFLGITVTKFTARFQDGYYTRGQGFENRTTIPPWDEYRRAQRRFRYDLANPALKGVNTYLVPEELYQYPTTTIDYFSFYREKLKKTIPPGTEPTKDPEELERYRVKYRAEKLAFEDTLNAKVRAHAHRLAANPSVSDTKPGDPLPLRARLSKPRPRVTRPDVDETEETAEEEPFTLRTYGPVVPRIEQEWSDSRQYEVPFLGITLSTAKRDRPYYTPGEGFEDRTTIDPTDEYARAQYRFKYDPWIEINKLSSTGSSPAQRGDQSPQGRSPIPGGSDDNVTPRGANTNRPHDSPSTRTAGGLFAAFKRFFPGGQSSRQAGSSRLYNGTLGALLDSSRVRQWGAKVREAVNRVDRRAHRLVHAWFDDEGKKTDEGCAASIEGKRRDENDGVVQD